MEKRTMTHPQIIVLLLFLLPILGSGKAFSQSATQTPTPPILSNPYETKTIDIAGWVHPLSKLGTTRFQHGELFMSSKMKGYYYVLVAQDETSTEGAVTEVKLRNVRGKISYLGYGLVFHSDPEPLKQDYSFLIDTIKRRYRVVRHEPQKEISLIKWTKSLQIKGGRRQNTIRVTDKGDRTELFINGQMITSIENGHIFKGGAAGLYSGDAVNIAFKDLTITK